ncbi:MAG: fatty acid--CoA ligase [Hyphomicrobiales bacterium]|nr:fatty acid--CoA ligase [Hyphomicrobiales bacterium]
MFTEDFAPAVLGDIARKNAALRGDAIGVHFEGRDTTFRDFDRHTNQVANGLVAFGVEPQKHIAYIGKNSDFYFELFYGAAKARAILAPVNWRLAPPEMAYIVNDCKAEILFVGAEFADGLRAFAGDLKTVRHIVVMEGATPEWQDFAGWRDAQSDAECGRKEREDDVAIQLYTSGTTGHPKGAMLTNHNLLGLRQRDSSDMREWNKASPDDVWYIPMPIFHIGGSGVLVWASYNGGKSVIAREFNPMAVLDDFVKHKVSKLFLVPAAMQFIVRLPQARNVDYSRLKYMMYGASPIPLDLLRECMDVFKCGFVQMYGMTETTGTIVALEPEDHSPEGSERMRSAGKPLPGVEIAILDAEGNRLPPREVGEIATRSLMNMKGYWNLPDASRRTMAADGWLRTGDAGYLDEDGYVYVHDRVKDMIISGAENIYPAEVENAIFGHPAVAEVAVIGVPDEKWGEAVKAVVALKPGAQATPDEIIAFARSRIAGFKTPRSVDFIEALPRNPSGKILKRELREPYWAGKDRRVN